MGEGRKNKVGATKKGLKATFKKQTFSGWGGRQVFFRCETYALSKTRFGVSVLADACPHNTSRFLSRENEYTLSSRTPHVK